MRSGSAILIPKLNAKQIKREKFSVTVEDLVNMRSGAPQYTSVLEKYEIVDTKLKLDKGDRY